MTRSVASPRRSRGVRFGSVVAAVLIAPVPLGFLGDAFWGFDLLSSFRPHLGVLLLVVGAVWWAFDRVVAGPILCAAMVGVAAVGPLYVGSTPHPAGDTIDVVSFNVGISNPRRADVAAFLIEESPDLVFLFESSFEWEDAMRQAGVPMSIVTVVPRTRLAGVTVLASPRMLPTALETDIPGEVAAVSVVLDGVEIDVLGMHPPSPTSGARASTRDSMLAAAGEWVAGRDNPVIVVGDFNATPWSASYRGLRWRGGLVDTLAGAGLQASWPAGWVVPLIPIDHVLHTRDLGSMDRRTGPSLGSAHRPVLVSVGPAG